MKKKIVLNVVLMIPFLCHGSERNKPLMSPAKKVPIETNNVPSTTVPQALYAEIHGLLDRNCIRVYVGSVEWRHVHGRIKSLWCRRIKPRIEFYNAQKQWIHTEPLTDQNAQIVIKQAQQRLSCLPTASYAHVVSMKSSRHQSVELYDEANNLVAQTPFDFGNFQEGDSLSDYVIKQLKPFIANPEFLKTVHIRKRDDITLGRPGVIAALYKKIS